MTWKEAITGFGSTATELGLSEWLVVLIALVLGGVVIAYLFTIIKGIYRSPLYRDKILQRLAVPLGMRDRANKRLEGIGDKCTFCGGIGQCHLWLKGDLPYHAYREFCPNAKVLDSLLEDLQEAQKEPQKEPQKESVETVSAART